MTVADLPSYVVRLGDGVTTTFTFPFPLGEESELKVYRQEDSVATLIDTGQYSVTYVVGENGGSIETAFDAGPLEDAIELVLARETPKTQEVQVYRNNAYDPRVVAGVWDKLTRLAQETYTQLERAVKAPFGQSGDDLAASILDAEQYAIRAEEAAAEAIAALGAGFGIYEYAYTFPASSSTMTLPTENLDDGIEAVFLDRVFQTNDTYNCASGVITFDTQQPEGREAVVLLSKRVPVGTVQAEDINDSATAGRNLLTGVHHARLTFDTLAAFLAATIPTQNKAVSVVIGERSYPLVRDAAGPINQDNGADWRPDGDAWAEMFGASGSATATVNTAAITAAVGVGRAALATDLTVTARIELSGDINISGNGATITRDTATHSGGLRGAIFAPAGELWVSDMHIVAPAVTGASVRLWGNDTGTTSVKLDGITLDLGTYLDEDDAIVGVGNSISALKNGYDETTSIEIWRSSFERGLWGFLKGNTDVSTERNIRIIASDFSEFLSPYMLFNSPASGSLQENILIFGNNMGSVLSPQPFIGGSASYPHRGSFAGHVHYTRLIGNHAYGYGGELFRAEEDAKASIWIANTAKLNGKDGIEIIANNAGGTVHTPTLFVVADNVIENVGLEAAPTLGWGIGLHVYTSVSGLEDAECIGESTVHDNVVKGWEQGVQVHQGSQRNLIHHNIIADNAEGIKTWAPSLGMQDNLISDCPATVVAERGGAIGRVHIRSATQAIPDPGAVSVAEGILSLTGWTYETGRHSLATGYTEYEIFEMPDRISGQIRIIINAGAGGAGGGSVEYGHLHYDGTTLNYYQEMRRTTGSAIPATAPIGIKNGNLAVRIYNGLGSAVTGTSVQVEFDGQYGVEGYDGL